MIQKSTLLVLSLGLLLFSGCALKRDEISLHMPASEKPSNDNGHTVYINSVIDKRMFELKPALPSTPSLDPDELGNEEIRSRAIARKRNTYGKALGDIVLKDGQTIPSVIKDAVKLAFLEAGYNVIENKENTTNKTFIVDVQIDKFWSWMNPGFWAMTLSTEISTEISVKENSDKREHTIYVKATDNYQTGVIGNWKEVMQSAIKSYITKVKTKL
ncbi:MAG: hypothetical protein ABFQ64_09215 [Campylobacterota bacterium]